MTAVATNPCAAPANDQNFPSDPRPEDTDLHGPKGLGGWLVLPIIGSIIRPFSALANLRENFLPIFTNGSWEKVTSPESSLFIPLWGPTILFEIAFNVLLVVFSVTICILMFRKSRKTPKYYIILLAGVPAALTIDLILCVNLPNFSQNALFKSLSTLAPTIVAAAIWIPYFIKSSRVKNTFINA